MGETLKPCPFCGGPAVDVACEYITCGSAWHDECAGHQIKCSRDQWNTRSVVAVLKPTGGDDADRD